MPHLEITYRVDLPRDHYEDGESRRQRAMPFLWRESKHGNCAVTMKGSVFSLLGGSFAQIDPGDEEESADEPQVLEERVLDHEPVGQWNLPEAVGNKGRDERKGSEPNGADPRRKPAPAPRSSQEVPIPGRSPSRVGRRCRGEPGSSAFRPRSKAR